MLTCMLMASGCGALPLGGGDAGGPAVESPESGVAERFARADAKVVTYGYPKSWHKLPEKAYPKKWIAEFGKSAGGGNAEVAVLTGLPRAPDAKSVLALVNSLAQYMNNFQRVKDRAITVPDAKTAWRLDYTYEAESGQAKGDKILGTDVAVVDDSGSAAVLRITRTKGAMTGDTVNAIVDSIKVTG